MPAPKSRINSSIAGSSTLGTSEDVEELNPSQSDLTPTRSRSLDDLPPEVIQIIIDYKLLFRYVYSNCIG